MTRAPRPTLLPVRVTPRASRNGIDGVVDGALRIRVTASPVDGGANAAVAHLIASALDVPASAVTIVRGATSRQKLVAIEGLTRDVLIARWPDLGV